MYIGNINSKLMGLSYKLNVFMIDIQRVSWVHFEKNTNKSQFKPNVDCLCIPEFRRTLPLYPTLQAKLKDFHKFSFVEEQRRLKLITSFAKSE